MKHLIYATSRVQDDGSQLWHARASGRRVLGPGVRARGLQHFSTSANQPRERVLAHRSFTDEGVATFWRTTPSSVHHNSSASAPWETTSVLRSAWVANSQAEGTLDPRLTAVCSVVDPHRIETCRTLTLKRCVSAHGGMIFMDQYHCKPL